MLGLLGLVRMKVLVLLLEQLLVAEHSGEGALIKTRIGGTECCEWRVKKIERMTDTGHEKEADKKIYKKKKKWKASTGYVCCLWILTGRECALQKIKRLMNGCMYG